MITKKSTMALVIASASIGAPLVSYASLQIEEIIVTANKRQESLNDVGATISVLSAEQLARQGIASMEDIAVFTPALTFARSASNTPIYTLRGIGFNETSIGVYPAVSVYLDEAPLTFPVLASHAAFDLERVEVLKGPQGTLFGQNSTGGAINLIAAKPTEEFEAGVTTTLGRFSLTELQGYVSGPLNENLRGRVAVKYHYMDEWQESVSRADENGKEDNFTGRVYLEWEPTDATSIALNLNGWKDKSDPQALQLAAVHAKFPSSLNAGVIAAPFPGDDPEKADWTPGSNFSDRQMYQATLRVEHMINDDLMLTSLSSFIDYDQKQYSDTDGVPITTFDLPKMDADLHTFSQELRLENTNADEYRWVMGVNYEASEVSEDQILSYGDGSSSIPNGGIFQNTVSVDNEMNNWAVFGNIDYFLTDALKLKVGARYTDAMFDNESCNADVGDGINAGLFNFLGDLFSGPGTFEPVGPGDCFSLNYSGQPGEKWKASLDEDNVSWRVGLDYDVSENMLIFGNISKGYKQGSFPTLTAATWRAFEPVVQESVLSYEFGVKQQLLDGRLSINTAAFYYEYQDKQIKGNINDEVFGILEALRNIPEVEVYGVEIDTVLIPVEGLTVSLAGTWLDHEITKSPQEAIDILGNSRNYEGYSVPYTADLTLRLDIEYSWDLDNISPFIGFTYSYEDEKTTSIGGNEITVPDIPNNRTVSGGENPFLLDEINVLNVRAGLSSIDEKWSAFIWAKNITDEYYWTNATVTDDTTSRLAAKPRTFGITATYNF